LRDVGDSSCPVFGSLGGRLDGVEVDAKEAESAVASTVSLGTLLGPNDDAMPMLRVATVQAATQRLHLVLKELAGPTWADIRDAIDKLRSLSRAARRQTARNTVSKQIRQEVLRIQVRLTWALEGLSR